jgi:DNA-directed RNA polymerase II subunit RPB2
MSIRDVKSAPVPDVPGADGSRPERFADYSRHVRTMVTSELKLSKESKLLRNILERDGFSNNIIAIFNHWIDNVLPNQISARTLTTPTGIISFSNLTYEKPSTSVDGKKVDLTPLLARDRQLTYNAPFYVDATLTPRKEDVKFAAPTRARAEVTVHKRILIGSIPIMLGSKLCHLSGKSIQEKIAMGECPNDPLGYYIIKGMEKTIIIQEKLRASMPFTYINPKGQMECRITNATVTGTTLVTLVVGKKWRTIKVGMHHMKGKHVPLFVLFHFLGLDLKEAMDLILKFVKPANHTKVYFGLQPSFAKAGSSSNAKQYHHTQIGYMARKRRFKTNITEADANKMIIDDIMKDLFANIPDVKDKLNHLAMMAARITECLLALRSTDERDDWGNKRLVVAAGSQEQLTNSLWDKQIKVAQLSIDNNKVKSAQTARTADLVIQQAILTEESITAFGSNAWGVKGAYQKENIVDSLKRETPMAVYSQGGRINTPASRKARLASIRMLQPSQLGLICAFETPEGPSVGLVKNTAITEFTSMERPLNDFNSIIESKAADKFLSSERTDVHTAILTVNGVIRPYDKKGSMTWCTPELRDYLVAARRSARLPMDCCIFYNQLDSFMEYWCNSARPTRPLFIVGADERLVMDTKNLWDRPPKDWISNGAVEYVDAREQGFAMLAQSPGDVRDRVLQKERLPLIIARLEDMKVSVDEIKEVHITYAGRLRRLNAKLEDKKNELDQNEMKEIRSAITELTLDKIRADLIVERKKDLEILLKRTPYEYSEIDPVTMGGIPGSLIPMANSVQGPRDTYQASMSKQALSMYHFNYHLRWDSAFKIFTNPSRPMFETDISEPAGLNAMPAGSTPIVAIMALTNNNEDSITTKKEYLRSNLKVTKYVTHKSIEIRVRDVCEEFGRPAIKRNEPPGRYAAIDEFGLPRPGALIKQGDCIIGKMRKITKVSDYPCDQPVQRIENASLYAGIGEEGTVERVFVTFNAERHRVVKVKIAQVRVQESGDKVASRFAMKATFGRVVPERFLPRIVGGPNDGVVPDFFINPHAVPSRMIMAMMKEMLSSKAALYTGERIDATTHHEFDIEHYRRILAENGADPDGMETMVRPNGKKIHNKIFVAPCWYQLLRHHVKDKFQARARGSILPISHQPIGGRANEGG